MSSSRRFISYCAIVVALSLSIGCGDDDNGDDNQNETPNDHNQPQMTAEEEACLHAREDLPLSRDATLSRDDATDDISQTHTHFRVTIPDTGSDEYEGYIRFDISQDAEYALFTSQSLPVAVFDDVGDDVDVETVDSDECPEIVAQTTFDLEAGDYVIRFGPSEYSEVSTVTETLANFE